MTHNCRISGQLESNLLSAIQLKPKNVELIMESKKLAINKPISNEMIIRV